MQEEAQTWRTEKLKTPKQPDKKGDAGFCRSWAVGDGTHRGWLAA